MELTSKAVGSSNSNTANWCGCPSSVNTTAETIHHTTCPVCLLKFDPDLKIPIGLSCGHTLCIKCVRRLHPNVCNHVTGAIDLATGLPNISLLAYLEYPIDHGLVPLAGQFGPRLGFPRGNNTLDPDCLDSMWRLADMASLLKGNVVSRAIHRKVLTLLSSLNPSGQTRICRAARAVGERALVELTSSCGHLSHYHAQQQLWAAIRARACQFMGPAMQEEALKLVLLALEDGSALSRKVLVMFVVQRLAPQFPQASKTSIGHVIQLLYRASCFDVTKRPEASSLMTLRPEFRNYDSLRREHDAQIVRIALDSGIRFSPEQWSSILYGDSTHKPHMQSIIDKLQAPQSFSQMTTEFLVSIQRLSDVEDSNFLLKIHPHFQVLAAIELQNDSPLPLWSYVSQVLEAVHFVLVGLVSFNPKPTSSTRSNGSRPHYQGTQAVNANSTGLGKARNSISLVSHGSVSGEKEINRRSGMPGNSGRTGITGPGVSTCLLATTNSSATLADEEEQIKELLAESQMLRAKMQLLQGKMPDTEANQLQNEVADLEQEASKMIQKIGIRS